MEQKTLAIIKPDAVKNKDTGKIIQRIEEEGFKIIAMKKSHLSKQLAEKFYNIHSHQKFFNELIQFMVSGPVIILYLEHVEAVAHWRKIIGNTDPAEADINTIRNLYGTSKGENAVHGSDSIENAKIEVQFFFNQMECCN